MKKRVHLSLAVYKLTAIAKRVFGFKIDKPKLVRISAKVSLFMLNFSKLLIL